MFWFFSLKKAIIALFFQFKTLLKCIEMSNYRLACLVCIFTKLALINPYFKKLSLIDAIKLLDYTAKLCMVLSIKFIHTYNQYKHINAKNTK